MGQTSVAIYKGDTSRDVIYVVDEKIEESYCLENFWVEILEYHLLSTEFQG